MKIELELEMMKMIITETIIADDNTSLEQVKKCILGKLWSQFPNLMTNKKIDHNHIVLKNKEIEILSDTALKDAQKYVACFKASIRW